jgi:hypothetical protein
MCGGREIARKAGGGDEVVVGGGAAVGEPVVEGETPVRLALNADGCVRGFGGAGIRVVESAMDAGGYVGGFRGARVLGVDRCRL